MPPTKSTEDHSLKAPKDLKVGFSVTINFYFALDPICTRPKMTYKISISQNEKKNNPIDSPWGNM